MSRSGYVDDLDALALGRWRQAVKMAINGKRGQEFLIELLQHLDSMPVKELAADSLKSDEGQYCTLGVIGSARGLDLGSMEDMEPDFVGGKFGIARAMAAEIMYENDECGVPVRDGSSFEYRAETPAQRYVRMRNWVVSNIKKEASHV